jgi:hypothetical protein
MKYREVVAYKEYFGEFFAAQERKVQDKHLSHLLFFRWKQVCNPAYRIPEEDTEDTSWRN